MVTSDKDFGQLVTANTFIFKPSRSGEGVEILGVPEIQARWGVQRPEQVVDVLALMGDASDNIPGVPGIGEKTAMKLIGQYGTLDNLLAHAGELTGRVKQTLETNREQALLSKRLATIICDAPCPVELDALKVQPPDEEKLKELLVEFEFNSIGRRLFGEDFKAGRGAEVSSPKSEVRSPQSTVQPQATSAGAAGLEPWSSWCWCRRRRAAVKEPKAEPAPVSANLQDHCRRAARVSFGGLRLPSGRSSFKHLQKLNSFCFDTETTSLDPKEARLVGLAFSFAPHTGYYVPVPPMSSRNSALRIPHRAPVGPGGVPAGAGIRAHREGRAQPQVRPERAQVAGHLGGREALRHDGGAQPDRAGDAARHGLPVRGLSGLHADADHQADRRRQGRPDQHGRCAGGARWPNTPPRMPM